MTSSTEIRGPEEFPPTSVILPTTRWTTACTEVLEQLGPNDELLVVCDDDFDPVAKLDRDLPRTVDIVCAGEPENCSGKANAIAAGIHAAANDRILWTDDDFHHPPDWLVQLNADYEQHGPVTEIPFFAGQDPLAILLEPIYAVGGTVGTYAGDIAWGGAVIFECTDLDMDSFLQDLNQSVSDDGILTEHLDITPLRRTRIVPMGGSTRETMERHVRFTQIARHHDPTGFAGMFIVATLSAIAALLFPLPAMLLLTLLQFGIYAVFGVRRWTFILAYPATLVQVPLFVYGIARRTFVWGGRRYQWRSKFDVEIVG